MPEIKINDLEPGDIIVVMHKRGEERIPYHAAIFAPQEDKTADVIHMGSGFKRTGIVRSTLAHLCAIHRGLNTAGNILSWDNNELEIQVFRSNVLDGQSLAEQAETWYQQGASFDEKRLLETLENNQQYEDESTEAQTVNMLHYLKGAARRNVPLIKSPQLPYPSSGFASGFASFFLAPSLNFPEWLINLAYALIRWGTDTEDRPQGVTCAGFVLHCIGAVALKDEISTSDSEWVSLKHGTRPSSASKFSEALDIYFAKTGAIGKGDLPGLDSLLTTEQLNKFEPSRLLEKLDFLAKLHPNHPSIKLFLEGIEQSSQWTNVGFLGEIPLGSPEENYQESYTDELLDDSDNTTEIEEPEHADLPVEKHPIVLNATEQKPKNKAYNADDYHAEIKDHEQDLLLNHQIFCETFGKTAFQHRVFPEVSFFHKVLNFFTGEPISHLSMYTKEDEKTVEAKKNN